MKLIELTGRKIQWFSKGLIRHVPAKLLAKLVEWIRDTAVIADNAWIISKLGHCGEGVFLHGRITAVSPQNIRIQDNVHIGGNSYLDGRGGISIGENSHISRNFVVHSSSHKYTGDRLPYGETYDLKQVTISRNVWIGTNVIVIPGVTIGEGAIVGAGAVVTKSVPSLAIVGSQPIRIIKYRDEQHYKKLDEQKEYGGIGGRALKEDETWLTQ